MVDYIFLIVVLIIFVALAFMKLGNDHNEAKRFCVEQTKYTYEDCIIKLTE